MKEDSPRRRRRSPGSEPPGGGSNWAIVPLGIVVVLAGLGIGKLLSMHFSGEPGSVAVVAQPTPLPSLIPNAALTPIRPTPMPSASPVSTASAVPTSSAAPAPAVPTPNAVPRARPTPKPEPTSRPSPQPTPRATARPTLRPTSAPAPDAQAPLGDGTADQVVRQYLSAIIHGEQAAAQSLLATGSAPTEQSFLDSQSTISSVTPAKNADGTYSVGAEVATAKGTYYITFTVSQEPDGLLITDHYAIKVQ